jgi:glycosyltransferase involved in cell wall biosynthesis
LNSNVVKYWEDRASDENLGDDQAAGVTQGVFCVELPKRMVSTGMVVVDAACGFGRYTFPLANTCKQVIAVDTSVSMLKRLQNRARDSPSRAHNLDIIRASMTHLPLVNDIANLLICVGTIYLLDRRSQQMARKEFERISAVTYVQYRNLFSSYNISHEINRLRKSLVYRIASLLRASGAQSIYKRSLSSQRFFLSFPDRIMTEPCFWKLTHRGEIPVVFIVIDGGPARVERITKIATSLRRCGVDVRVVCPSSTETLAEYDTVYLSRLRFPYVRSLTFNLHLFLFLLCSRPSLVHFVNYPDYAMVPICFAKYLGRFKVVYDRRSHWSEILSYTSPRLKPLALIVERLAEHLSDGISVVVPSFKENLSKYGAKVGLVPNGVDLEMFRPENARKNRTVVACVGALTESEGARIFIEAASVVRKRWNDVDFVWVGSGSDDQTYAKLSEELGAHVQFVGWVEHGAVSGYINGSDVCVSSVLSMPSADVAFPVKLFEYLACMKPVVVSDTPGHLQLITQGVNGLVYKSNNAVDLAEKIVEVLTNRALRERLAREGRELAVRYSWENCFRELLSLYERIGVKIQQPASDPEAKRPVSVTQSARPLVLD